MDLIETNELFELLPDLLCSSCQKVTGIYENRYINNLVRFNYFEV